MIHKTSLVRDHGLLEITSIIAEVVFNISYRHMCDVGLWKGNRRVTLMWQLMANELFPHYNPLVRIATQFSGFRLHVWSKFSGTYVAIFGEIAFYKLNFSKSQITFSDIPFVYGEVAVLCLNPLKMTF